MTDVTYVRLLEQVTRCATCNAPMGHLYVSQVAANLGDPEDYYPSGGPPFRRAIVELFKQERDLGAAQFVLVTDRAAVLVGDIWQLGARGPETPIPLPARVKCQRGQHANSIEQDGYGTRVRPLPQH